MGAVIYMIFSLVIALACGVNPNEENRLGTPKPTTELKYVDPNVQYKDDNHVTVEKRTTNEENDDLSEGYPYFLNLQKMNSVLVKPLGNMLRLQCKAAGDPTPTVTWTKNNEEPSRRLGNIRYGPWSLTMEDLETDDSGVYTCHVCNPKGCINFTSSVEVVEMIIHRPILTDVSQNKTVVIGSDVNFTCTFVSDLRPIAYWVRGPTADGVKHSAASEEPGILELHNVTHDSEDWYTCLSANSVGVTTASVYLKVVDTLEEGSQPQSTLQRKK